MTRHNDREQAIILRKKGMSYSQIKEKLGVGKSTLSLWLRDMPLSEARLKELCHRSERQIERTRETKRKKRIARLQDVYLRLTKELGGLSERELYIAGFFLYWGEGLKADRYTVMFTNTDPAMVKTFIRWIALLGVQRSDLKVYLHLYEDMHIPDAIAYWSKELSIRKDRFRKPYIKKTVEQKRKNYKGRFGFGTCNIYITNRDIREKIAAAIAYFRETYGGVAFDPEKAV